VELLRGDALPVAYGHASDAEFLSTLPLRRARWLVCTVREDAMLRMMLESLAIVGYSCRLAFAAAEPSAGATARSSDVDLLLTPYADAADAATGQLFAILGRAPDASDGSDTA